MHEVEINTIFNLQLNSGQSKNFTHTQKKFSAEA